MSRRCGFVAVIGAPNAGKSTLVNALVGGKVSIVSPKVQTTRSTVRGIAMHGDSQVIFLDTPGIFQPQKNKRLERAMVAAAWAEPEEADIVMLVVDAARGKIDGNTDDIVTRLSQAVEGPPCVLVLNKIDGADRAKLMALTQSLNERYEFAATFMISALKEDGTTDILDYMTKNLPEGPYHYPEDQISDMPARLLAAEITREKLFHRLYKELPYAVAVETEDWEQFDDGSVKIDQCIYVTRDSHKPIILGKGGSAIKKIGEEARKELEELLGHRVHLKLFVKVDEKWEDDPGQYQIWGLDYQA